MTDPADALINDSGDAPRLAAKLAVAKAELAQAKTQVKAYQKTLDKMGDLANLKKLPAIRVRKGKAAKHIIRLIVPDSHGAHIDAEAEAAILRDTTRLQPQEIVYLGDHLDCGGTFSSHQRSYTSELTESYADDVAYANRFLDAIQKAAPDAKTHYIYGNHEAHIERWASREFQSARDAQFVLERIGPAAVLDLKRRGFTWYLPSEMYMGLTVPGTIRIGECFFTHGMSHAKHADAVHLQRVGANVVFGHVHRNMSIGERTVTSAGFGAWCPGTLAKLQPLYRHTQPTSWQHGYAVQFVNVSTGTFAHWNVAIHKGTSMLSNAVDAIGGK